MLNVTAHRKIQIFYRLKAENCSLFGIMRPNFRINLTKAEAEGFYAEHKERGFFGDLVAFMTSGPVVVSVLEGENAVLAHREILGATNPKEAAPGTIRADFDVSIDENAAHGSDSVASADREVNYFFAQTEVCPRTR